MNPGVKFAFQELHFLALFLRTFQKPLIHSAYVTATDGTESRRASTVPVTQCLLGYFHICVRFQVLTRRCQLQNETTWRYIPERCHND
jgi:hypothetical protein